MYYFGNRPFASVFADYLCVPIFRRRSVLECISNHAADRDLIGVEETPLHLPPEIVSGRRMRCRLLSQPAYPLFPGGLRGTDLHLLPQPAP